MQKVGSVITVFPHGNCASKNLSLNAFCDDTAKQASELISSKIKHKQLETYLLGFESGMPNVDMDVYTSRTTPFRRDLSKLALSLKNKYGSKVVLLDVHSFPATERPEWKDSEVVIVETRTLHDELESVGLAYYLNNNGVSTKVVIGTEVDIAQEMDSLGLKNIVLEFNQQLSNTRLNQITALIAEWIQRPAGSVPTTGIRGGHGYRGGYGGYGGGGAGFGTGAALGLGLGLLTTAAIASPGYYGYGYGYPVPPPAYYGYPPAYGYPYGYRYPYY